MCIVAVVPTGWTSLCRKKQELHIHTVVHQQRNTIIVYIGGFPT